MRNDQTVNNSEDYTDYHGRVCISTLCLLTLVLPTLFYVFSGRSATSGGVVVDNAIQLVPVLLLT